MLLVLVEYSDEEVDGSSESVKKGPAYSWTDAIIIGGILPNIVTCRRHEARSH